MFAKLVKKFLYLVGPLNYVTENPAGPHFKTYQRNISVFCATTPCWLVNIYRYLFLRKPLSLVTNFTWLLQITYES